MVAKYQAVASALAERIRRGELEDRERLPGELDLAEEFGVSRGTIRQALSFLQRSGLIETWTGSGSFVSFDGVRIGDGFGWTKSLERRGVPTTLKLLALGRLELPALAARLDLGSAEFLCVDRVRSTAEGEAISLERSRIPWRASFDTVLATGLTDGSIQATMAEHGLIGAGGTEAITVAILGSTDAELLGRRPGEAFLETEQITYDAFGSVIEIVTSLLHPAHFTLQHSFGKQP